MHCGSLAYCAFSNRAVWVLETSIEPGRHKTAQFMKFGIKSKQFERAAFRYKGSPPGVLNPLYTLLAAGGRPRSSVVPRSPSPSNPLAHFTARSVLTPRIQWLPRSPSPSKSLGSLHCSQRFNTADTVATQKPFPVQVPWLTSLLAAF
jgi:hypothetical protein